MNKKIFLSILILILNTNICFAKTSGLDKFFQAVNEVISYSSNIPYQNSESQNGQYYNQQNSNIKIQNNPYQVEIISSPYNFKNKNNYSINPFGSINWDDNLFDTVMKLKRMQGIKKLEVELSNDKKNEASIPVFDNKNNKWHDLNENKKINLVAVPNNEILLKLNNYLISESKYHKHNDKKIYRTPLSYRDSKGINKKYLPYDAMIVAGPVYIEQTPFNIQVSFKSCIGLAVYNSNKIFVDSTGVSYPLIITKVELVSYSKALNQTRERISQLCQSKFRFFMDDNFESGRIYYDDQDTWSVVDQIENQFKFNYSSISAISPTNYELSMSYIRNMDFVKYLDELYKKHLSNLEVQRYKSTPNSGSEI